MYYFIISRICNIRIQEESGIKLFRQPYRRFSALTDNKEFTFSYIVSLEKAVYLRKTTLAI
jgi:hypothetical protein